MHAARLLLAWLALACRPEVDAAELRAGQFEPPHPAPAFTLPGSRGEPVSLAQFRGKVVVIGFGFTSCPDVCPVTLATLAAARRALGERGGEVQVLYVTVDPERDGAERMRRYVEGFHSEFLGLTGEASTLAAVRRAYGVASKRMELANGQYLFGHSSSTYLIDRQGRLRAMMPYGREAQDYVHDLSLLLDEP